MTVGLIVHADDLGLTAGVNAGILAAHRQGLVTSASLMVNTPGFADAITLARGQPALDLGIHLTLTTGRPCRPAAELPSLVDGNGLFHRRTVWLWRAMRGAIAAEEVAVELSAQVERALATGLRFSHLDGHHHVHLFGPTTAVVARLARRYRLSVVRRSDERRLLRQRPALARLLGCRPLGGAWRRQWLLSLASRRAERQLSGLAQADFFAGLPLSGPGLDSEQLAQLLLALPAGTTELMCHPGYADALLAALDPGAAAREREVALLTRADLGQRLAAAGVLLRRSADLAPAALP